MSSETSTSKPRAAPLGPLTDEEIAELRERLLGSPASPRLNALTARLLDLAERAKKLLGEMEWSGISYEQDLDMCPNPKCAMLKSDGEGHKPDCELAALIGKK